MGICLLVDFPGEPATIPAAEVNRYCNQVGYTGYGNNGSIRDCFYSVSDGNLRFINDPATTDTGVADPPDYVEIADTGAYEFAP